MLLLNELWNPSQFKADLALRSSPIHAFKKALQTADAALNQAFINGHPIADLIYTRATFMDVFLKETWSLFDWSCHESIALIAVGGYGRGELHPHSDIDLLMLHDCDQPTTLSTTLESWLTLLWDIGLHIGHSVRNLQESVQEANQDITVMTNLLESRCIIGSPTLFEALKQILLKETLWSKSRYFEARKLAQIERHAKHNDTEYKLEPNVKTSPGGLRDIHSLMWVARYHFHTTDLNLLTQIGLVTPSEAEQLIQATEFLWRVRYGLHLLSGRAEDRLLFDIQAPLARLLGYRHTEVKELIEAMMRDYYRNVMFVSVLTALCAQYFEEKLLASTKGTLNKVPLNPRFFALNGYVEICQSELFDNDPSCMLEVFVLMAKHPELRGLSVDTHRQIQAHLHLIDESFRNNPTNTHWFMALLCSHQGVHRNLRRMNRCGLLGCYIPEFGQIIGQMQHDLFHVYTVDAHTLNLIKNLRRLWYPAPASEDPTPLARHLVKQLPKPELLYIAGLFHDIAKGRGGDHSILGGQDVVQFCQRHGLSSVDTEWVSWLVLNHLVMSSTSQRQDISDPEVIHAFAIQMRSKLRLDYLYILTVADILATNPNLWTSWRASLLKQLYWSTCHALIRGLDKPLDREAAIQNAQKTALDELILRGHDPDAVELLWAQMGDDYFLLHSAHEMAWQTEAILNHHGSNPLIVIRASSEQDTKTATQIFIYAPDQRDFFAVTVAVMSQLNLSIQEAQILSSTSDFTLDTYHVLDGSGQPLNDDPKRITRINQTLLKALEKPEKYPSIVQRMIPRQLKHFNFEPVITLYTDTNRQLSVLELVAPDRPGLLACVGQTFLTLGIQIHRAKIVTLGERVEDIFWLTDSDGHPISDVQQCDFLVKSLSQQLSTSLSENTTTPVLPSRQH